LGAGGAPGACGQDIAKTGFLTSYSYGPLNNLLTVNQGSLAQRTFAYDSLSRLLCAANPETGSATCPTPDTGTYTAGTTRYGYDANGNLAQRTRPAPNLNPPNPTVTTTYQYDALNRLTQQSYLDGVTLPALFGYDQTNITMGSQQFTIANSIGRLSWTCVQAQVGSSCPSMTANSYDPMGRIAQLWQSNPVNSNSINIAYGYDFLGDEISRNLSGTINAAAYNGAGRLTSFTATNYVDANNPANLLANVHYDPMGHMISGTLANGLSLSWGYDSRGRVKAMEAGTNCSAGACSNGPYGYLMTSASNQPGYAPNGNVLFALDSASGFWAYTYDDFNRLATSTCSGVCPNGTSTQAFSYGYDRYGNRWNQTVTAGSGPQPSFSFTGAQNGGIPNNRIDSYTYDAAGNLLNDGSHNYKYDAESRIISVDNGATTYTYDATGQRVTKATGGSNTDFLYDREGHVLLYNSNPAGGSSPFVETYVAGMHLGTYYLNSTVTATSFYYNHSDWLGTERARTNLSGIACETIASLPFGDGQAISGSCGDISHMHFTGKERDSESGLDNFGARYSASSLGRFMTPDPGSFLNHLVDPQGLNRYAYTRNNPLIYIDPDGKDWEKVWQDAVIFSRQLYTKATFGVGLGGDAKAGSGTVAAEASVTGTVTMKSPENGGITFSRKAEVKATATPAGGGAEVGVGASVSQVDARIQGPDQISGQEAPEVEVTPSFKAGPVGGDADEIGIGDVPCAGICAGFEMGSSKEGWAALGDALVNIKNEIVLPSAPAPPTPPAPVQPVLPSTAPVCGAGSGQQCYPNPPNRPQN
jgi:RHS repeat-associated protein